MDPHEGPVVLVTGAAQGIGRATAFALAEHGYRLALIDRDEDRLRRVVERIEDEGACVAGRVADVSAREELAAAIGELERKLGPIEVLLACAGIGELTMVPNLNLATFRSILEVNVLGVAHAIEAILPGMIERKSGHIIGLSSVAGFRGLPWMASYCASKAAVTAYLESLRPGLKRRGIRVTTVCPGFVRTGLTEQTPFRRPVPMLEPEEAARHLVRVIARRPRDYVFPFTTALGMRFLRAMPNWLFDWMMDRAGPRALRVDF